MKDRAVIHQPAHVPQQRPDAAKQKQEMLKKKKKTETNLTTNRVYDRASGTELAFSTLGLQSQPVQILPSFSVLRAQALTLVLCLP